MLLSSFLFFMSVFIFLFYNIHYIVLLLILELMLLGLLIFFILSYFSNVGLLGGFLFLLMMVCMGGYSISLLVCLSRFIGRDFWFLNFVF